MTIWLDAQAFSISGLASDNNERDIMYCSRLGLGVETQGLARSGGRHRQQGKEMKYAWMRRSTLVLCSLATSDDSCLMGFPSISRPFVRSLFQAVTTFFVSYFAVAAPYSAPMSRCSMNTPKFEGWHYNAFAEVVPRQRVLGRDLGKTFSMPIVTFKSIDSIQPSDAHFLSLASTTPSISIAAQEFSQHLSSYDISLISNGSSIDDSTDPSSSEMCSTGDILSRESIEHIDKALDGDFYAFSKSFPWSVDTTLWRQLYSAMARDDWCQRTNIMMGIYRTVLKKGLAPFLAINDVQQLHWSTIPFLPKYTSMWSKILIFRYGMCSTSFFPSTILASHFIVAAGLLCFKPRRVTRIAQKMVENLLGWNDGWLYMGYGRIIFFEVGRDAIESVRHNEEALRPDRGVRGIHYMEGSAEADRGGSILDIVASGRASICTHESVRLDEGTAAQNEQPECSAPTQPTLNRSIFTGNILFSPIPTAATIPLNIGFSLDMESVDGQWTTKRAQWRYIFCNDEKIQQSMAASAESTVLFHLFTTQYHQVFSVSGLAGNNNEWGIEMIWLKWLLLSFNRPPSFDPRRYKHGRYSVLSDQAMLCVGYRGTMGDMEGWTCSSALADDHGFAGESTGISQAGRQEGASY
ncbi:hypothetical protein EDD85DRAFT_797156 [Armillaria nabsnona]|nr:hypothetical protein EDD85DRAFT_797156 [Armillaria nabsnona]